MKKALYAALCLLLLFCITASPVWAADYNYVSPEQVKTWILEKKGKNKGQAVYAHSCSFPRIFYRALPENSGRSLGRRPFLNV